KVIAMYEKCRQRHAWVDKPVGFLDNLSYISINAYTQITNRIFSCENLVGGKIAIHITPQEVVYFLGVHSYANLDTYNNLISVDDDTISIYNFFNLPSSHELFLK
ncbi:19244_t:CDS:1, partial [Racocetra persica]